MAKINRPPQPRASGTFINGDNDDGRLPTLDKNVEIFEIGRKVNQAP